MRILAFYFGRFLGVRILAILFALSALLVLMDIIENIEDVLERRGSIADVFLFVSYRLPTIVESVIPVSVLIGSVLGILALSMHSELTALRAAGVSQLKVAALGLPFCLLVVLGHYVLADRIAPSSEKAFVEWWEPLIKRSGVLWLRGDENIVKIGSISRDGTLLAAVTIFSNDASGELAAKFNASTATYANDGWTLYDVVKITVGQPGTTVEELAELEWPGGPKPEVVLDLVSSPEQLTKGKLTSIISTPWSSTVEQPVYMTELARRSVVPLTSLVMMLLAAAAIRGQSRAAGPQIGAAISIALGLTFLIVDGLSAALGRAGLVAPELAAWTPLVLFAGAAGFFLLRFER